MDAQQRVEKLASGRDTVTEMITTEELRTIFGQRDPRSMWGILPLAPIHFHLDRLIVKQWDIMEAGCTHIILLADTHAKLQAPEMSSNEIELRSKYYEYYFQHVARLDGARIVFGSSFQEQDDYVELLYRAHCLLTINTIRDSLPDYLSKTNFTASNILHAIMEMIDHIKVSKEGIDFIFASTNQRRTYMVSRDLMRRMGLRKPTLVLSSLCHDINGRNIGESKTATRLNINDDPRVLKKKIAAMYAPPHTTEGNPLVELFLYSILPWFKQVEVPTESGRKLVLDSGGGREFVEVYRSGEIHPTSLKRLVFEHINERSETIKKAYDTKPELLGWLDISRLEGVKNTNTLERR